jgi:hypothetical protein
MAIIRNESRKEKSINAKRIKRLATITTTLRAAIIVIIQTTRIKRIHDL